MLATSVPIVLASISELEAHSCYVNKILVKKNTTLKMHEKSQTISFMTPWPLEL